MGNSFAPTETLWNFMQSDKFVRVVCGPIGSGKSVAMTHEIMRRAFQQKPNEKGERKFRAAVVRNTVDQLRSTTMKTFFDWFPPGVWGTYKASEKTLYIDMTLADGTKAKTEILYLSLDTPDDVRKALSLELTACWLNEARELHPDVIDGLLMRLHRYPSKKDGGPSWSGAILDTNGPNTDSYHHDKMVNPPANWDIFHQPPAILNKDEWVAKFGEDPPDDEGIADSAGIHWWVNPTADNVNNLPKEYYPSVLVGKSRDFVDVYLRGRFGRSLSGLPVFDKTFNYEVHVAATAFAPLKSDEYPVIIGLDFGRTPAAALLQRNVWGQIVCLDELNSENMGIETFLETKLKPLLAQEKYLGCHFIVAPDPAGYSRQQIGEISPVDVVKKVGFKVVKPNTNDPERRVMAVERALTANVGGKPTFQINPHCKSLIAGFRYGYKYKIDKKGIQADRPEKDKWSHGMDALQYACLIAEGNQLTGSYFGQTTRREIKRVNYAFA